MPISPQELLQKCHYIAGTSTTAETEAKLVELLTAEGAITGGSGNATVEEPIGRHTIIDVTNEEKLTLTGIEIGQAVRITDGGIEIVGGSEAGIYTYRGTFNGKPYYNLVGRPNSETANGISWDSAFWRVWNNSDSISTYNSDGVESDFPWQITSWVAEQGGDDITVTQSPLLEVLTALPASEPSNWSPAPTVNTGIGNATVPDGMPITPPQAFVDAAVGALTSSPPTLTVNDSDQIVPWPMTYAQVPGDVPIQPPQAFVDAIASFVSPNANLSGSGATHIDSEDGGLLSTWWHVNRVAHGPTLDASGCALTVAEVNGILSRLVELTLDETAADVSELNLSGGTNAAPTLQLYTSLDGGGYFSLTPTGTSNGKPTYAGSPTSGDAFWYDGTKWIFSLDGDHLSEAEVGNEDAPWDATWPEGVTVEKKNESIDTLISNGWTVTTN